MKIFLDTDVILDFLLDRPPFSDSIGKVFQHSLEGDLQLCASPITITNLYYIIGRLVSKGEAKIKIKKILKLVDVETVCKSTIDKAAKSSFKDFEDAVQNFCAIEANHNILLTRNTKDYKESEMAILTPNEFIIQL